MSALALLAVAGCSLRLREPPEAGAPAAPVALVTEGSAFTQPDVRERIERAVREVSGRPVLVVSPLDGRSDPRRALVARLAKVAPRLATYDWREPRCAAEADVLVALASSTDAVYHVALDATTRNRPVTAAERASETARSSWMQKMRAAVGGGAPESMREETVVGSVALSIFTHDQSATRLQVEQHDAGLDPGAPPRILDPPAIAGSALRRLPPPRVPEWESYARRLIASGCPLLAMSVADARLGAGRTYQSVKSAALDGMQRSIARRGAPATVRNDATRGTSAPTTARGPQEETPSCEALCTMHMVELCNRDLALWIDHRVRWETTPCGVRRPEEFLVACYAQQWQSGTFEDACLTPCETKPEGRERLVGILRRGGCLPN